MSTTPVRDPERVLAALLALADAAQPHDLRVGQAIANALLVELGPGADLARLFHVEDGAFADLLGRYAERLKAPAR